MPTLDEAQRDAVSLIEAWEARTERVWSRAIRSLSRIAADRLERYTTIVAAAGPPDWHPPAPDELVPLAAAAESMREATQKNRAAYAAEVAKQIGRVAQTGISFDVRNPLIEGVIAKHSGTNIVGITETLREELMTTLQDSWERGDSVPHAATAMRARGFEMGKTRAQVIARTELNSINNGASHAAVQTVNQAALAAGLPAIAGAKHWQSAHDARTRPDHAAADGQIVALNQTFSVGGYPMAYPGDPDGPAREVVNCRCTLTYSEAVPLGASGRNTMTPIPTLADDTTETPTEDAGGAWSALLCQEGVDTGDGRRIEPNAVETRDLPLTLMAMIEDSAYGHEGSQVAGRIDAVERAGQDINGTGVFDSGEYGVEIERLVRSQMLRGVSVDLAVDEWTMEPPDGYESDPNYEPFFDDTFVIIKATLLGATVCPFPAFADAKIVVAAAPKPGQPFLVRLTRPLVMGFTTQVVSEGVTEKQRQAFTTDLADLVSAHPALEILGTLTLNGVEHHITKEGVGVVTAAALGNRIGEQFATAVRSARILQGITASAAGAARTRPPIEWFSRPEPDAPTPITITPEGEIYGHAALWGTCHLGLPGCTTPPANASGQYTWFHLGEVDTEGGLVSVGTITLDTGHASLQVNARNAVRHYDDTGTQAAYVRASDGKYGIWVCGSLKPDLDMAIVAELRAAKLSGDWRPVAGQSELVGLLAVNVPGFPVPREQALAASGADGETHILALVAAGIPNEQRARAVQALVSGSDPHQGDAGILTLRQAAYIAAGRFSERIARIRDEAHA